MMMFHCSTVFNEINSLRATPSPRSGRRHLARGSAMSVSLPSVARAAGRISSGAWACSAARRSPARMSRARCAAAPIAFVSPTKAMAAGSAAAADRVATASG